MIYIDDKNIGQVFGCYEVISNTGLRTKDGHRLYNCKCTYCGTIKQMQMSAIKYDPPQNCPHYITIGEVTIPNVKEDNSIPNKRLRQIFIDMIKRCYNSRNKSYRFYGEKGIKICSEWINSPRLFYEWAMANGYKTGLSIDRIKDNKDYSPDNCRWVNSIDNSRYKSNTNYITATVTLSGRQWADLMPERGINYINTMLRDKGMNETVEYIENRLSDKRLLNNTDI